MIVNGFTEKSTGELRSFIHGSGHSVFKSSNSDVSSEKNTAGNNDIRQRLNALSKEKDEKPKTYVGYSVYKPKGILEMTEKKETAKNDSTTVTKNYDVKNIASEITRAKKATTAGAAVIKASRQVRDLKRKLSMNGSDEELKIALNYAKKLERIAKKKKHNLELEELVERTKALDEKLEENSSGSAAADAVDMAEEKLRDELDRSAEKMVDEFESELSEELSREFSEELSEDMIAELSGELSEDIIDGLSDSLNELIDDTFELLEEMTVIDPHMSDEDFEKLKQKHRSSEQKDMVKADMEYLRDMLEHYEKSAANSALNTGAFPTAATAAPAPVNVSIDISL